MLKGGTLALRAGLVIAATVGLAVMLAVLLASLKFERKLLDVTTSRLAVVAEEVRRRTEYGLTLGLDLAELEDLGAVVARAAAEWGEIDWVTIAGENGQVVFSSDTGSVGGKAPVTWAKPAANEGALRNRVEGDHLYIGAPVRNSFGQYVGEVVLRAALKPMRVALAGVRTELRLATGATVGAAALLTLLAVFVTVRLSHRVRDDAGAEGLDGTHAGMLAAAGPRVALAAAAVEAELEAIGRLLVEPDAMAAARGAGR